MRAIGKRSQKLHCHDWQSLRRHDVSDSVGANSPQRQRLLGVESKRCRYAEFCVVVSLKPAVTVLP